MWFWWILLSKKALQVPFSHKARGFKIVVTSCWTKDGFVFLSSTWITRYMTVRNTVQNSQAGNYKWVTNWQNFIVIWIKKKSLFDFYIYVKLYRNVKIEIKFTHCIVNCQQCTEVGFTSFLSTFFCISMYKQIWIPFLYLKNLVKI